MRDRVLYALARMSMQRNSQFPAGSREFVDGVEKLIPLLDERVSAALVELLDGGAEWLRTSIR